MTNLILIEASLEKFDNSEITKKDCENISEAIGSLLIGMGYDLEMMAELTSEKQQDNLEDEYELAKKN
jgi:hypothetical protein